MTRNEGAGGKFFVGGVAIDIEDLAHKRLVFTLSDIVSSAGELRGAGLAILDS